MRSIKLYIFSILIIACSTSCKKYLDLTPTGQIVINTAAEYYNMVSYPNRAYPINNFQYLVDDQWIRESYVIGISKNIDIINFEADTITNRVNLLSSSTLYNRTYQYINRWNMIISLVDASEGDDATKKLAKAEARVLRAFDYFVLVNTFGKPYAAATAAKDGGICIMDKYDLEAKPVKSSVAAVYDFIEKDLDESIPNLSSTPVDVYHPSIAFAYALKAKLHLFKGEWDKSLAAAQQSWALNNNIYDYVAYTTLGGPKKVLVPAGANPEVLSYQYMSGRNEMNFAYVNIISPELKNLFGANDARYNLFFNSTSTSFLDIGSGTAYWNIKYTAFFYMNVGIRTPEVLLMMAECYARQNNLSGAMDLVNQLRAKRITNATEAQLATPSTIKETMEIIIAERRKELLFGFNRFWDLRRLNLEPDYAKTVTHTFPIVNKTVPQVTYSLPPNSRLYTIPFAQDVLKLNTSLTLNTDEALPW